MVLQRSFAMHPLKWASALVIGAVALTGCATAPQGPSIRVLPAPGKPFEVFASDDSYCRGYAQQTSGNATDAANASGVGTAVAGTAIGAAAGALLGGRNGAGAGAGFGLLAGSAIGADQSGRAGYSIQRRYDNAYAQCMYAKGNLLPGQSVPYNYSYYAPPPPPPAMAPPPPPPPGTPPPPPPGQ
jgi:hypothetical protein